MNVKDAAGWELRRQQADGAQDRILDVSWRVARNALLALGVCGIVLVGGSLLAGRDGLRAGGAISAARFENGILKARQDALRERASILLDRLEATSQESAPLSAIPVRRLAFAGAHLSVR